ncbi:Uncharacterized protein BM_BM8683 [Brugia malayi]|uniref:Bm8683 n=2 Tax=Brugia TaxID=6278 RepID=A0A0K0JWP0_BRUMA|nr:Uncharacterized protein BM_BM8683 [Brugia malayi]CDQ04240.1 Bm8683 [Brugia malayi]VIO94899.1 Uncharacterized protein BM_BM8683 [Brugia malayi]
MLCKTKNKQKMEQMALQNAKVVNVNETIATKQSSPECIMPALSTTQQTTDKLIKENVKKALSKQSPTIPMQSEANVKKISLQSTQTDTDSKQKKSRDEKFKINKTQSETEFEDVSLATSMLIDKTQASISQRVDDSADTGEYVDDLPEDEEKSSSE